MPKNAVRYLQGGGVWEYVRREGEHDFMAHEILIMQMPTSGNGGKGRGTNFLLPRSDRRLAQRAAAWLQRNDLQPELILVSPGKWEKAVATSLAHAMHCHAGLVKEVEAVSKGGQKKMIAMLGGLDSTPERLLIIGNRGVALAWSRMLHGRPLKEKSVLQHLHLNGHLSDLQPGMARSCTEVGVQDLPKTFPFPGPDGVEQRSRPAYYYSQSGVIPYKLGKKGPEILLVRSSGDHHWVIPKGVREPGFSSLDIARQEAMEEAGIIGKTRETPLGHVRYRKWGAPCHCEVFAMEVTRLLPPRKWPERQRGRQWFAADQAAERLKHRSLGGLVRDLASDLSKSGKNKRK